MQKQAAPPPQTAPGLSAQPSSPCVPVFYGVQATGNGHIYRYRGISERLERIGWNLTSIAVGQEQFARHARTTHWTTGLSFDVGADGIHFTQTLINGLSSLPGYLRKVGEISDMIESSGAGAVVCDFEPLTARAAVECSVPLLILDNQTSVFCLSRRSVGHRTLVALARQFTSFWYGPKSLEHSHSVVTVSLSPERPGLPRQIVVPPPVREEVLALHPVAGRHAVLYASFGGIPMELIEAARRSNFEIRIHVPEPPPLDRPLPSNILIRKAPSPQFLDDIRSAGAIIAQAGFMTSAEAALLGKPVAMVPLKGQFEQVLNGLEFERLGVGKVFPDYGASLLEWVGDNLNQSRVRPEIQKWLGEGVGAVAQTLNQRLEMACAPAARRLSSPRPEETSG